MDEILVSTVVSAVVSAIITATLFLINWKYIESVRKFERVRLDIAGALEYYANVYSNPIVINPELEFPENYSQASASIRKLGTDLRACIQQLSNNKFVRKVSRLPSHDHIKKASASLIGLSNGLSCTADNMVFGLIDTNHKRRDEIRELLRIKP